MDIIKKIRKKVFFLLNPILIKYNILKKQEPSLNLQALINTLNSQINNSHFTQALLSIKAIVKIKPNSSKFQLQLIKLLKKNLFYKEAFETIKKNQIDHPSEHYFFYLEEAKLLQKIGYKNKALLIYKKLIKFYPLKTELITYIQKLENAVPDVHITSATGQLEKIKNQKIKKMQTRINISKLQKVLFKDGDLL
ncbi:MAG: hypothetical protein HAW60_05585 [Bdellovibrionales bacterium]|nr:hypothetical protein [Bdellovibrionales bacterium]